MDNLTHSLIGMVAGEAACRLRPATKAGLPADTRRAMLVTLATVGSNLPDIDLVLTYQGFTHDKLGYLLEHRGYTHTVLGGLLLAVLLYAAAAGWARFRRLSMTGADHLELAAMAIIGVMLHLGMDALNSYGVHPFWPYNNHWIYGDSVFIVEPLYWLAAAPLFFIARSIGARAVVATAVIAAIVSSAFLQPSWIWFAAVMLATAGMLTVGRRGTPRTTAFTSAAATVAVTAMFAIAGHAAARDINSIAARDFPGEHIIDHVLSPIPTSPFCWDILLLATNGGQYTARHGILSNAPGLIPAAGCSSKLVSKTTTAPLTAVAVPNSADVEWFGEFAMPVDRLADLTAHNCEAAALMEFVRAPFAIEHSHRWIIGDLRFDREHGPGLAKIDITDATEGPCTPHSPWLPPRADLLRR